MDEFGFLRGEVVSLTGIVGDVVKLDLAACAERERCAVVGELLGAAAGQGPGFVYLRDRRTGAEGAWWDCAALPRANPTRCLPKGTALARMLADWR